MQQPILILFNNLSYLSLHILLFIWDYRTSYSLILWLNNFFVLNFISHIITGMLTHFIDLMLQTGKSKHFGFIEFQDPEVVFISSKLNAQTLTMFHPFVLMYLLLIAGSRSCGWYYAGISIVWTPFASASYSSGECSSETVSS